MLLHNKADYLLIVARRVASEFALRQPGISPVAGIEQSALVTALKFPFLKVGTGERCPRLPI